MITVNVYRTVNRGFVDPARAHLVQYASWEALEAAHNGTLPIGVMKVSRRHCRTWIGAQVYMWRMRRTGARAQISSGPSAAAVLFRSAD